jgi:hypothetical protein
MLLLMLNKHDKMLSYKLAIPQKNGVKKLLVAAFRPISKRKSQKS